MKAIRSVAAPLFAAGVLTLAASCSDRRVIPKPAPSPTATAAVRPPPPPPPAPAPRPSPAIDWRDAPLTPGTWQWAMEGTRSVARFGGGALILSCERSAGTVTLLRPGIVAAPPAQVPPSLPGAPETAAPPAPPPSPSPPASVPITILTSTMTRPANGEAVAGPPPFIALPIAARDPALDALAFSRGRFAIETAGLPTLYVPSWPEVGRVVEDCR